MMRKLVILLLLVCNWSQAQKIRPFLGGAFYRDSSFDKSTFMDFKTGIEFNAKSYFKPEIEMNFLMVG